MKYLYPMLVLIGALIVCYALVMKSKNATNLFCYNTEVISGDGVSDMCVR